MPDARQEHSQQSCQCDEGSRPCDHCGNYVFSIDCNVWHATRRVAEAVVKLREAEGLSPDRMAEVFDAVKEYEAVRYA